MPFQTEYFLGIIKSLHLLMLSLAAMNLIYKEKTFFLLGIVLIDKKNKYIYK